MQGTRVAAEFSSFAALSFSTCLLRKKERRVSPGRTTRSKDATRAPGLTTRSRDVTRGSWHRY